MRKTVDEIDIDRVKTFFPQPSGRLFGQRKRLDSVNRFLNDRVVILDTERSAIAADLPERCNVIAAETAGIDLDTAFAFGMKVEGAFQDRSESLKVVGSEESRGAAAEMKLFNLMIWIEMRQCECDFLFEVIEVAVS